VRVLAIVLVALIATLQYPMWLGKGGWLTVRALDRRLDAQQADNAALQVRNEALEADVRDLKTGFEAIEERARSELGMIRGDEVFFQLQAPGSRSAPPAAPAQLPPPK
jgi:cell division protein FtsB